MSRFPNPLQRAFRIIAFDWDGTAVVDRRSSALAVRAAIETLLERGVAIVVVTGTNFPNIDRQLCAAIEGPHKRRLYVASNRGSEVYGFDERSRPVVLWRRTATPDEEKLLTEVAEEVRARIAAATGLD